MRWIFRGLDAVGRKGWVYGDLVHNKRVDLTDRVMVGGYEVLPESVGLCTGIKDDKGKYIYQGDIISVYYEEKKVFDAPVTWHDRCASFMIDESVGCYSPISADRFKGVRIEIIGNVYNY